MHVGDALHNVWCMTSIKKKKRKKKKPAENFPGGTVVKTPSFQCGEVGLILGQGTRIPHVTQHSQKTKSKLKI